MSVGILGTLERGIPRISLGGKGIEALSRMPTKSAKGWRSWRCPDAGRCPSVGRSTFTPGARRAGPARWPRLHRHRQALGDRAARCTPGRGRALDGAEGEELGGLDALGEAGPLIPVAGSMAAGSTATARPSAIGPLDAPRGEAGRSMAPRARSWAGSMRSARLGRSSRWARRWRGSMRWRRGRGAGPARWPRPHRHRQALGDPGARCTPRARPDALDALGDRVARCTPGRGRALDGAEGEELGGLDVPWLDGHGSTATARPSAIGPLDAPRGEAGARCAPRARPDALDALGDRVARCTPGRGRALDGAEGEELGGLDVPWLDGHGSTATARPSAIGPLDAPRGEAGARCAPRARPDALDALGDRVARCTPGRGRALDGAEGEELGGLDALGEAGPLIPVGEALAGLDEMAPRARSWAGSMATAAPPPPGPRRSGRSMHPGARPALDALDALGEAAPITPVGEALAGLDEMAPRARSWAGSMATAAPPPPGPRRSGRSMHPGARPGARWRRGRGAGRARCALARWPRLHRHRQALGDRAARCTPGRGRRSMRPEGEAGCARCARRSGRSMHPGARPGARWRRGRGAGRARCARRGWAAHPGGGLDGRRLHRHRQALGDRVARCTPGRGRALDGAEGEELGGLDALGEAGPLIPVAGSMAAGSTATARPSAIGSLDAPRGEAGRSMAPRARSWAGSMCPGSMATAPPPPPGPRRSGRSMHPGARPALDAPRGRGRMRSMRSAIGSLDAPRGEAGRSMAPRARSWAGSMRSARLGRSSRWARRWRGSMRWRRGRGAGPARWPRPHRHRQALGDPGARCTPGRGRALDGAEGEELGGLDVPWLDGHGSTATARPSAIGPLDAPRGEAGARCAPRARPDALDALGDRVARCTPGRGRALDGAEGEELGGLDALGEAGPLIPVAGSMAAGSTATARPSSIGSLDAPRGEAGRSMAPRARSWAGSMCPGSMATAPPPPPGPRRSGRSMHPGARPALDAPRGRGRMRSMRSAIGSLDAPRGEAGISMAPRARSWGGLDAHRLDRHRQALGELAGLDALGEGARRSSRWAGSWTGSTPPARPPPPGPQRAGRARCARRGRAPLIPVGGGLDRLDGRRLARPPPPGPQRAGRARCARRGRAPLIPVGGGLDRLDGHGRTAPARPSASWAGSMGPEGGPGSMRSMAPRARSWAGSMATAAPPPSGPRAMRAARWAPRAGPGSMRSAGPRRSSRWAWSWTGSTPPARPPPPGPQRAGRARCARRGARRSSRWAGGWTGSMATAAPPPPGPRRAGRARWAPRVGRARCARWRRGEELGGLDALGRAAPIIPVVVELDRLDATGSTAPARPSASWPGSMHPGARLGARWRRGRGAGAGSMPTSSTATARPSGDAGRSMRPEGGAGLDALGRAGPLIPVGVELGGLDGRRLHRHRQALGDRAARWAPRVSRARCARWRRGRGAGAGSMPTGSTATARPSAIGPLDGPRGWAGLDALDDAEGEELGRARCPPAPPPPPGPRRSGRSMGPEGGPGSMRSMTPRARSWGGLDAHQLHRHRQALGRCGPLDAPRGRGGLDALGRAGPLIPVGVELGGLDGRRLHRHRQALGDLGALDGPRGRGRALDGPRG